MILKPNALPEALSAALIASALMSAPLRLPLSTPTFTQYILADWLAVLMVLMVFLTFSELMSPFVPSATIIVLASDQDDLSLASTVMPSRSLDPSLSRLLDFPLIMAVLNPFAVKALLSSALVPSVMESPIIYALPAKPWNVPTAPPTPQLVPSVGS